MVNYYAKIIKRNVKKYEKFLVLGYSFKENVSDIRNSKNLTLIKNVSKYFPNFYFFDPLVENKSIEKFISEKKIKLKTFDKILILVKHNYFEYKIKIINKLLKSNGKFVKIIN